MSSDANDLNPNDNNAHLVYYPAAVFAGLCPILVALRTWARVRRGGKMGADDWASWAALVSLMVSSCVFAQLIDILIGLLSPHKCFFGNL